MNERQYTMEWNEILGDMVDDVREYDNTSHNPDRQYEEEQALIHEAIAQEQELTSADLDDWYESLIIKSENFNDHKGHSL